MFTGLEFGVVMWESILNPHSPSRITVLCFTLNMNDSGAHEHDMTKSEFDHSTVSPSQVWTLWSEEHGGGD